MVASGDAKKDIEYARGHVGQRNLAPLPCG